MLMLSSNVSDVFPKDLKLSSEVSECKPLAAGATVAGTLTAGGATTLSSTLAVTSLATLSGGAAVTGATTTTTLDVNGVADISGTLTLSGTTHAVTHTGATGMAITSTSGYVDVEDVRFTGAQIGTSNVANVLAVSDAGITVTGTVSATAFSFTGDFVVGSNKFTVVASSGNTAVAGTLAVTGITTLAEDLRLSENTAALTHTGTTGLAITSTSGYVDVEDLRFTGAAIGVSGTPTVVTVASGGAAVTGTLSASAATTLTSAALSADITMSNANAALTHTAAASSDGLAITSTNGYVDVESVRFTGAAIGISTDIDLITLTSATVTVAGAVSSTTVTSSGVTTAASLDVNGVADVSGTLTLSGDSQLVTHSGTTGLAITSTSGYVDVEDVRFTGAQIGTSNVANVLAVSDAGVTVTGTVSATAFSFTGDFVVGSDKFTVAAGTGNTVIAGTLAVTGITTLAEDLRLSENTAALTHTGTTGLAITSTSGYVDVEDLRFTGAAIGVSGTPTVVTVASGGAAVSGTLSVTGAAAMSAAVSVGTTLSVTGATALSAALSVGTTLGVTGAATVGGTLAVAGATGLTTTLAVGGAATLGSTLAVTSTLTLSDATHALTHTGSTGLAIASTSGYVDVEEVRFTGAQIGTSNVANVLAVSDAGISVTGTVSANAFSFTGDFVVGSDKFTVVASSGNTAIAGTLAVTGITTLADDLRISENTAALTHTGATGLAITSTSGYVDVEEVRFTGASIGVSGDTDLITLSDAQVTVAGSVTIEDRLDVGGDSSFYGLVQMAATLGVAGDVTVGSSQFTVVASSGNTAIAGTLAVTGITTLAEDLRLSENTAALTHTGATGMAITSTIGYVDVEDLRFTGSQIGTSNVANVLTVSDAGVSVTGLLSATAYSFTTSSTTSYATLAVSGAGTVGTTFGIGSTLTVRRCSYTLLNPELKARLVSALETTM